MVESGLGLKDGKGVRLSGWDFCTLASKLGALKGAMAGERDGFHIDLGPTTTATIVQSKQGYLTTVTTVMRVTDTHYESCVFQYLQAVKKTLTEDLAPAKKHASSFHCAVSVVSI